MIVTDQFEPMVGGVPTVTGELAHGLSERGHAVAVIAPSTSRHSTSGHSTSGHGGQASRPGSRVAVDYRGSLPWPWYEGQRLGLLPPAAAGQAIPAFPPALLHLPSPLTLGLAARRAARRRGVPVIYTNHYLPLNVWPALAHGPAGGERLGTRARQAAVYGFVPGVAN